MSATMAKRKPGRPAPSEPKIAFQIRIPVRLNAAIETARLASRRQKNTEIQIAIEKYLEDLGFWTPSPAPSAPEEEPE